MAAHHSRRLTQRYLQRFWATLGLALLCTSVGCGAKSDKADAVGTTGAAGETGAVRSLSLPTADGKEAVATSLRCIYRQATGADDTLSLQLQFLRHPDHVAFAVYVDDPRPATPYEGAAGQDSHFDFEAYADDVGYRSTLRRGEIVVHLDALPSPDELSDGQDISLRGRLDFNEFSVSETDAYGATGAGRLGVGPGKVPIVCTTSFSIDWVLN